MPVHLENVGDESNIDDFENRRFYVQPFEMSLYGYILDESDFQVIPTVNRAFVVTELYDSISRVKFKINPNIVDSTVEFNFIFQKGSNSSQNVDVFSFTSDINVELNEIKNLINISNIEIKVNNILIFNGTSLIDDLLIDKWDNVLIKITRTDVNGNSTFTLKGNSIS
jgi:hypothetical protein